jgi:hypothetical protein
MRNRILAPLALLIALAVTPASADTVNVFVVGSNPPGNALDPGGANIGGVATISWNHNFAGGPGPVFLTILAEGIDGGPLAPGGGENDEVFFNNVSIGELTQQPSYSPLFNLQPGPGALAGITELTLSVFDVTALVLLGVNTVRVEVDSGNWVNEIEVSTLESVPLPPALVLFATGLAALGLVGRRRKKQTA